MLVKFFFQEKGELRTLTHAFMTSRHESSLFSPFELGLGEKLSFQSISKVEVNMPMLKRSLSMGGIKV